MKKSLFLGMAAMAALVFTGCQKDVVLNEVPQDQPIAFGTYLGRDAQTKGTVLDLSNLASGGFGVFAYYTGENEWPTSGSITYKPNFMYNQQVTGTGSGGSYTWTYSPTKYWPLSSAEKFTFFAYAPYDANNQITNNQYIDITANNISGAPKITYRVDADLKNHYDLVFANPQKNKDNDDGPIQFNFFHALSRVGFSVAPNDDIVDQDISDNTTITIKKLSLTGEFYPRGVLDLGLSRGTVADNSLSTPAVSVPSWSFTDPTEDKTFEILSNEDSDDISSIESTTQISNKYLMILPQVFDNTANPTFGQVTINVTYDVVISDPLLDQHITFSNTKSTSFNHTFEAGKAYDFKLMIGLNAIKFSATVENWDEQDSTEIPL